MVSASDFQKDLLSYHRDYCLRIVRDFTIPFFIPLWMCISIGDYFFRPDFFYLWLLIRVLTAGILLLAYCLAGNSSSHRLSEFLGVIQVLACSSTTNYFIYQSGGIRSAYLMGLVTIVYAGIGLFRFTRGPLVAINTGAFLPLIWICYDSTSDVLNGPFISVSMILICIVILSVLFKTSEKIKNKSFFEERELIFNQKVEKEKEAITARVLLNVSELRVREKSHLLSVLSHDISNPLISMQLIPRVLVDKIKLIEAELNPRFTSEAIELLGVIERSSKKISQIIRHIRNSDIISDDGESLGSSTSDIEPSTNVKKVHIRTVLDSVCETFSSAKESKQITISIDMDDDSHYIWCQPIPLESSIINNLISNAIKFSPKEGTIFIGSTTRNGELILTVEDEGKGISDTHRKIMFTASESFSTPGTCGEIGTGLGLPIVKSYMEKFGGTVRVGSRDKNKPGSKFSLHFPIPANKQPKYSSQKGSSS